VFALAEIFFRPAQVFARVRAKPRWAVPFVATVMLFAAATILLIQMAGMELITLQGYLRDAKLSERVGQQTIDQAVNSSNTRVPKMIVLSRNTANATVVLLAVAGILTIAASSMQAQPRPGYARMLAMTSYAVFPFALIQVVGTWVLLSGTVDMSTMNLDHVVNLSLARLIDPSEVSPSLLALAQAFDLLMFAQLAFLAYGFSKVAALPYARCLAVCAALWAVAVIWKSAIAVIL
jgi:hypothetical protein